MRHCTPSGDLCNLISTYNKFRIVTVVNSASVHKRLDAKQVWSAWTDWVNSVKEHHHTSHLTLYRALWEVGSDWEATFASRRARPPPRVLASRRLSAIKQ
jgi:hypothetical protein